ncbi:diguanylate cyclase [Candidatus Methylospira mobilis]|uniref:diguanylate cyclase n=1 Tax=Candidatus Methylospira mobilis TaxID=1808979 RepID=A0A5Q0BIT3_9GAMM|nr:diguanylate cyclase [Candidatus Methylospira mobilis]QFY43785.1 diguanylate cyclase [Candidatus Methylospira mobilis]WNV04775.1 diguanylate cyclase [Candidatus Methylospira mobilis]
MILDHNQLTSAGDILVVDDSPENLRFLVEILTHSGYRARPAINGELALRSAQLKPPVLILLDIRMHGMDGFETCRRLKENEQTRDIPVIFASSMTDTEAKIKGFKLGAVDYVAKPLNAQEVLLRIATHLSLSITQRQLQTMNSLLREAIKRAEYANRALLASEQQLTAYSKNLERLVLERTRELDEANRKLTDLSEHDALTGLANRRKFDEVWQVEWLRALRQNSPLSVIMADIDDFKAYNDCYGHQAGDACLQKVACAIEAQAQRSGELVARYGGEEFVVILPNVTETNAWRVAESIRADVEALAIPHAHSPTAPIVTLSLGVAGSIPGLDPERDASDLLAEADKRLYLAKEHGRNQVALPFRPVATLFQRVGPLEGNPADRSRDGAFSHANHASKISNMLTVCK